MCCLWRTQKQNEAHPRPQSLEVMVTNNMFGGSIADLAATLQGGLSTAASRKIAERVAN